MMPKSSKRTTYVTIPMTPQLKAACKRAAQADGGRSLANWIRYVLSAAAKQQTKS